MKKVWIEPGCIACTTCQFIAPEVFKVEEKSRVIEGADLEKNCQKIELAAKSCPVNVIKHD